MKNLINEFKKPNYFNIINFYYPGIKKLLFSKSNNKNKVILRNSYLNDLLINKYFNHNLNFENTRIIFFRKNIFAYTNNKDKKEKIIEYLKFNCSSDIQQYLNYADNIIKKKFKIFKKEYDFTENLNWHYSFFRDFYWKLEKSENLQLYPYNQEVDVKYVWEFNRHQFLCYLGFAYYYTSDEKYAKEFKRLILDWVKKNPPLYGINWYSGLEISLRLTSWIFSLFFFKDSKEINNQFFFKEIFNSMFQHAYFLKSFYSRRRFNHTVGELFGLYLFLKVFKELNPLRKWEKRIFNKFRAQIFLQTRLDGTCIEQSGNYHRFILEFFTLFLILNPDDLQVREYKRIEKMYLYLLYIIKPNREFPKIGDLDDGKVLMLTYHENLPYKNLFNIGSILFQNNNLKLFSNQISGLSVLLFGNKGLEIYNKLVEFEPPKKFKFFKNSGYFVIRNDWSTRANYLFGDFGRFGAQNAGHSHSSITNFILSNNGKDIIIDSGTYNYNISLKENNFYRGSMAHNILTINQKDQAIPKSRFEWVNKPKIKRSINIENNRIKLTCYHNGYKGFIVRRDINTTFDLNNLIIEDTVYPIHKSLKDNLIKIDILFHFNNEVKIERQNNEIKVNDKLKLKFTSDHNFILNLRRSLFSPNYGTKLENDILEIHLEQQLNNNQSIKIRTEINSIN